MPTDNRRHTFIVIPYPVQVQNHIPWPAKAIWATVDGFTRGGGECWLSIPELAQRVGLKPRQTSQHIQTLMAHGWVEVGTIRGRKRGLISTLDLDTCEIPQPLRKTATIAENREHCEKPQPLQLAATDPCSTPHDTHAVHRTLKEKENETSKPTIIMAPKKKVEPKKVEAAAKHKARPTGVDEVAEYMAQLGASETEAAAQAKRYWDHWETSGWIRKNGRVIRDWRAAARMWLDNKDKFNTHGKQQTLDAARAIAWANK